MSIRPVTLAFRIVTVALTVVFIVEQLAHLKTLPFIIGNAGHNVAVVFADWLDMLQPGFCVSALWAATNVFARLGRGEAFNASVVKGLRGIGLNLVLSAVCATLIVPNVKPVLLGNGWSPAFTPDVESVTIGMIGFVLYLVARQGTALKAELESFV